MATILVPLGKPQRSAFGQMKPSVLLCNNCFVALVFVFFWTFREGTCCDTKWIRMVFMMTCGRKKRTSLWYDTPPLNLEQLPPDFNEAYQYLKKRNPNHPMFSNSSFWELNDDNPDDERVQKLLIYNSRERQPRPVLLRRLSPTKNNNNFKGIQGFPEEWDLQEIDDTQRANTRRTLDNILEECCKLPRVKTCNQSLFEGAC